MRLYLGFLTILVTESTLVRRVIKGSSTPAKPWMVLLDHPLVLCGGTLYTKSLVITSAHNTKYLTRDWKAHVDRNNRQLTPKQDGAMVYDVIQRINHPRYTKEHCGYDVSVWWIPGPSNERTIVDLDNGDQMRNYDRNVNILGWGSIDVANNVQVHHPDYAPILSDYLRLGIIPIVQDNLCLQRYPHSFKSKIMFCIGQETDGPAAGLGDSGGPVYRIGNNYRISLMGIISFSSACGYKNYYDVVDKVSNPDITEFILDHVNQFQPKFLMTSLDINSHQLVPSANSQLKVAKLDINRNPTVSIPASTNNIVSNTNKNQITPNLNNNQINPNTNNNQITFNHNNNQIVSKLNNNQIAPYVNANQMIYNTNNHQNTPTVNGNRATYNANTQQVTLNTNNNRVRYDAHNQQITLNTNHRQTIPKLTANPNNINQHRMSPYTNNYQTTPNPNHMNPYMTTNMNQMNPYKRLNPMTPRPSIRYRNMNPNQYPMTNNLNHHQLTMTPQRPPIPPT